MNLHPISVSLYSCLTRVVVTIKILRLLGDGDCVENRCNLLTVIRSIKGNLILLILSITR